MPPRGTGLPIPSGSASINTKAMRHTIKMRRMEKDERSAFENACDAYAHALGDFITTPLGQAAAPQQPNA